MPLRLAYLGVTNAFALPRLPPMSDRDKDVEILALRHQPTIPERQPGNARPRFSPDDRALPAALPHRLPTDAHRRPRLPVHPQTVPRWHRDLLAHRHAARSRPRRPGRPRTTRSIRPRCCHRRTRTPPGATAASTENSPCSASRSAASTVRQTLQDTGNAPVPERTPTTWSTFLPSQADAPPARDFLETRTMNGARLYVLAAIEHTSRRIRALGATAHPTASRVTQTAKNLVTDLGDEDRHARLLIRDHDGRFPAPFDTVLADTGTQVVLSAVRTPRMNAITERRLRSCRREPLDRTLTRNQRHLLHALRQYEHLHTTHPPHQGIAHARP